MASARVGAPGGAIAVLPDRQRENEVVQANFILALGVMFERG
jgi:hypothetical protein